MIEYQSINHKKPESRGKKYKLLQNYARHNLPPELSDLNVDIPFATLYNSSLYISAGYLWDGPTGAVDTADFMEGSMVHDILCEAIEIGAIPEYLWNVCAKYMRDINKEEGMSWARRTWTYLAVRAYGRTK